MWFSMAQDLICSFCKNEYSLDDGLVSITEWLSVDPCECGVSACGSCMRCCYQCGNTGECFDAVCRKCNKTRTLDGKKKRKFVDVKCKEHTWYACKSHKKDGCQECSANKNYGRYDY